MNAARDLAATGTPGAWELSKPASGDPWIEQVGLTGNAVLEHEQVDCMSYCYGGSSRYNLSDADALKIVRAVNALPAIADLLDAIDNIGTPATSWPNIAAARDAVAAALTGETP